MRGLFDYDSPLSHYLNKMVDAVGLSLLWIITSLPLITMGAATAALYYTTNKVIRHDRGKLWTEYWKSFCDSFKQATPLWLLLMALAYILGTNGYWAYLIYESGESSGWIFLAVVIPVVLVLMWTAYLFPMIAKFQNTTKRLLKSSFLIAIRHLPSTVLLVCIFLVAALLVMIIPLALAFVPVVYMLFSGWILERIFPQYMSPEDLAMEQERNKVKAEG